MFDTSGVEAQVRVLQHEVKQKQDAYNRCMEMEALFYLNISGVKSVYASLQRIFFENGIVVELSTKHGKPMFRFSYENHSIAHLQQFCVRFCKKTYAFSRAEFMSICTALSQVLARIDSDFFKRVARWQNVVRPSLTPDILSALYCACAVRWVAGQFPSTPLEDALVGYVIPRIVFGNEISHDQNKTKVV